MEVQNGTVHPRKRRRRRRPDRPAIAARLLLDDRIQGEAGILSADLFDDLFPQAQGTGMQPPPYRGTCMQCLAC
jgi:peroxin-6